jgi:signal transduction histidine kinase
MFLTYRHLDLQLRRRTFQREFDVNPTWILRGSFSEREVREIMGQLIVASLTYSLPLTLATLTLGYFVARKSLRPISRLNQQLEAVGPRTLDKRVELAEADEQFRDLLHHLNAMLARLEQSFSEMSEYAAKVAHELRTPLTILRLKVEQAQGRIEEGLAEELESELHRLAHVVDQSLLIAKADQGRLRWISEPFDFCTMLSDVVKDFRLLADYEGRNLECQFAVRCIVNADQRYCRQIVHTLLSNALTHGRADIRIRLIQCDTRVRFTVLNHVRHEPKRADQTLGLGLRVVQALLKQQPTLRFRRRQGTRYHATCLTFPSTPLESIMPEQTEGAPKLSGVASQYETTPAMGAVI